MSKQKIHHFINFNAGFNKFIYVLIILNVGAIILESYSELKANLDAFFYYFETFSVFIFSVEYVLRIWTAPLDERFAKARGGNRFGFMTSTLGIIDLLAILPFYLPLIFSIDLRVLRILRLFRLLRIFKLGRLSKSLKTVSSILKETKDELAVTVLVAFILLILSSTLMYYIESEVQPDKFGNIGESLWWSVATLTTVGYGDVFPVTGIGKVLSAVIALIGIGFIALPTGIISSAFIGKIQEMKAEKAGKKCKCPNCGTTFKPN